MRTTPVTGCLATTAFSFDQSKAHESFRGEGGGQMGQVV